MDESDQEAHLRASDAGLRMRMRSEERRIESQHERLDELCCDVYAQIDASGARHAINDFLLFVAALDAHMTVEEDIYFPALHGLRPDSGDALASLVSEHDGLRRSVALHDLVALSAEKWIGIDSKQPQRR